MGVHVEYDIELKPQNIEEPPTATTSSAKSFESQVNEHYNIDN